MASPSINSSSPVAYFISSPSDDNNINALLTNVKWGNSGIGTSATVYYSFPDSNDDQVWSSFYRLNPSSEINNNFTPLTDTQKDAATTAFNQWAVYADINFVEVPEESSSGVGDIRIANSGALGTYTYAYAYLPAYNNPVGGDIWFNTTQPIASGDDYSLGSNGFQTMMHEIGHALGLDHPFEGDATLSAAFDTYQYSIMSYSDIAYRYDQGNSTFYPTTPMLLDVLAIQYLYGANMSYNTGDNTYYYSDAHAYETIWDAGGTDTIDYSGSLDSVINLNAGQFSSIGPSVKAHRGITDSTQQDNIAIAYNVTIENAIGGTGNDTIHGNSESNYIDGGLGEDTFVTSLNRSEVTLVQEKSSGEIVLYSTSESDTLVNIETIQFSDSLSSVTDLLLDFNIAPSFSSQVNGQQTTTTPETYNGPVSYLQFQLIGSSSNEIITGASTNDFLNLLDGDDAADGGDGQDVLDGGTGSNFLTGGTGVDTFFLDGRSASVTWSTVTDFNGDAVNVWGWIDGTSQILLQQIDGASGFTGATLHMDLNGDNHIDTSLTLSGLSLSEVDGYQTLQVGGNGYLLIS